MTTQAVRRIRSADLEIAVREVTPWSAEKQSLILVHGYPDQQDVWDPMIAALPHDDLHIVTYDVRGAGASDVPSDVSGYRTELLVQDLAAVVEATVPEGRPVHLVGHDWGSVQLWDAVNDHRSDPRLTGRIASFTSISGPSLDHIARLARDRAGRYLPLLNQMARSWYVYAFQVPVLPELAWKLARRASSRLPGTLGSAHPIDVDRERNAVNGVNLYRANMVRRATQPGVLRTDVPVLLIHPRRDPFLSGVLLEDLEQECLKLTRVDLDAGHWVICSHAEEVAELILAHVRQHELL